jgi:hypothetical protein
MIGTEHMTDISERQQNTVPGMASWAGSGPPGRVCGDCQFKGYWHDGSGVPLPYEPGLPPGSRRSKGCTKYYSLMGQPGPEIDADMPACRYFQESEW